MFFSRPFSVIVLSSGFTEGTYSSVMVLPLNMLWKVRLTLRQKLGLARVFSLAFITIIVAVIRASQIGRKMFTDVVFLAVWVIIESNVGEY